MQNKKGPEEPFTAKLDIPMVSTSMFERVVDESRRLERIMSHIEED